MNLDDARTLALSEMAKWGLIDTGWSFSFNNRKRAFGVCRYDIKCIQLSRLLTTHEPEWQVLDTIRHEIAHVLAGVNAKHGPEWKRFARLVGASPLRRAHSCEESKQAIKKTIKYVMICDRGSVINTYLRKPASKVINNIHKYQVKGRPSSLGKLKIEKYNPSIHKF